MLLLFWRNAAPTFGTAVISARAHSTVIFNYSAAAAPRVRLVGASTAQKAVNGTANQIRVDGFSVSNAQAIELSYALTIADLSDGSWTNQVGSNVNLYDSIDEGSPSDADYIQSSLSPAVPDEVKLRFGPLFDPNVNSNHTLRYRYRKDVSGTPDRIDLTVRLYRADGVTLIAQQTHTDIDALTDGILTLSAAEASSIPGGDYFTGLVLGLSAVKV